MKFSAFILSWPDKDISFNGIYIFKFLQISNAERAGYDFAVIFDPTAAPVEYFHFGK